MKKELFIKKLNKYIHKKLISGTLNDNEIIVIIFLMQQKTPVRQSQIANELPVLGSYERFENRKDETTNRMVRSIIRDLRVNHGIPIISDTSGYWLPITEREILDFVKHLEILAKA